MKGGKVKADLFLGLVTHFHYEVSCAFFTEVSILSFFAVTK